MTAPANPAVAPELYDPQVRAAILRMSRHIAWMFWLWIGIPLILAVIALVMISMALSGNGS